jgi:hypothetical protein
LASKPTRPVLPPPPLVLSRSPPEMVLPYDDPPAPAVGSSGAAVAKPISGTAPLTQPALAVPPSSLQHYVTRLYPDPLTAELPVGVDASLQHRPVRICFQPAVRVHTPAALCVVTDNTTGAAVVGHVLMIDAEAHFVPIRPWQVGHAYTVQVRPDAVTVLRGPRTLHSFRWTFVAV